MRGKVFTQSVIVVLILLGIDPHHNSQEPLSPDGHPVLFLAVMTVRWEGRIRGTNYLSAHGVLSTVLSTTEGPPNQPHEGTTANTSTL